MLDRQALELDDDDVAAINQADAEIVHGEFVDFDAFSAEMRKRFPRR